MSSGTPSSRNARAISAVANGAVPEGNGTPRIGRPRSVEADDAIIAAAQELLNERCFAELTIEEVARRAGVGKATVYRRWASKEELWVDAVRALTAGPVPPETDDPRADTVRLLRHQLSRPVGRSGHGVRPDPALLARLIGDTVANPELARVWRERLITPRRQRLLGYVRRAVEAGQLRCDTDLELAADLLLGPVLYRRLVTGAPPPDPETLVDAVWRAHAPDTAEHDPRTITEGENR